MCGITGKLSYFENNIHQELIQKMNSKLFHRGPDEEGLYIAPEKNFGMAIRRLKIIDLVSGSQPIFNETKDVVVVLNGEIYNYLELRKELELKGHSFTTNSDTETIAHAYEEYDLKFLEHLNGMFAISLWDQKKKRLILARDRLGIKPLYYRANFKGIAFASEIKALLQDPDCSKELDFLALDDYFSLLYVPQPRSIFKSIKKLEPGHFLLCDLNKKSVTNETYWERPLFSSLPDLGWNHYKENLDRLFLDSLKLQLRSDVPSGLFLSSGLDSAALLYYASRVSSQKIKSFTVHFPEESYSEKDGAKALAEVCGSEHQEILLQPNAQEIILKLNDFFDEPFADSSAIPTYLLCQAARKHITVALSGEGGDELFAGYPTYIATQVAPAYKKCPLFLRTLFSKLVEKIPVSWDRISWEFKLKQFVRGAEGSVERSHFAWKEIFTEYDKKNLYSKNFLAEKNGHDGFESFKMVLEKIGSGIELEKLLYLDQKTYLLDEFLVKSDRMSMAHALEVRVPILDHRIVEFAATIPSHYKLKGLTTKWTLRKLLEDRLPKEIIHGKKKGFSPPLPQWIAGTLKPFFQEILSYENLKTIGLLRPEAVRQLLDEHLEKKRDHHRRLWALLNFALWHKKWM
ncbi:MAG: asparagine synthase (glutamine-hydrolyzing) [Elusimicrobia bacterium]|nr:asparagine synthase (glutamine-hydrolyzing) [Elusimicrobiota bacterium]